MTESDRGKAEQFVQGVESLAKLLRNISVESTAEAIKEEACDRSVAMFHSRREQWVKLAEEMGNDMRNLTDKIEFSKNDMTQCLSKTKAAVAVFNGSEFKEATDNLERFVGLCERFQSLKTNGFLDTVVETIGRV